MRSSTLILTIFGIGVTLLLLLGIVLQPSASIAALGETPRPSPTPSTTPMPSLTLPAWINDPDINIYVAEAYEEGARESSALFTIINVDTGQREVLDYSYIDGANWYQSADTTYLRLWRYSSSGADNSEGFVEFVDIRTGELNRYALDDETRPDRQEPQPATDNGQTVRYEIWQDNQVPFTSESGTLLLENPFAARQHYFANVTWHGDFVHVQYWTTDITGYYIYHDDAIYDQQGEILRIFDSQTDIVWANKNPTQFLYLDEKDHVCRVDLVDNEPDCSLLLAFQIENDAVITGYAWTPDDTEILIFYRNGESETGGLCRFVLATRATSCIWERSLEYTAFKAEFALWIDDHSLAFMYTNTHGGIWDSRTPRDNGLCILNLDTNDTYCPTDDLFTPDSYLQSYHLSPDHSKIALAYTEQHRGAQDGMCIHDLERQATNCPVDAEDLGDWYIDVVGWSPDGRHVVIVYTGFGPASDDKSFARFGFVDVEAVTFRDEGNAFYESSPSRVWRP